MQSKFLHLSLVGLLLLGSLIALVSGQRNENDDFDDEGFDDSGYSNQPSRDAEESNQNPSNYSPQSDNEDLDDDDDVDETQLAPNFQQQHQQPQQPEAQQFYSPVNSMMLANVAPLNRYRRSAETEGDVEEKPKELSRNKRYAKSYIGPVYTYVKTDKHAHYKWGVKHKVGKHYG